MSPLAREPPRGTWLLLLTNNTFSVALTRKQFNSGSSLDCTPLDSQAQNAAQHPKRAIDRAHLQAICLSMRRKFRDRLAVISFSIESASGL